VVGDKDEGALDGGTLSDVAGEGVAVVEMLARVAARELAPGAGVVAEHDRCLVERDDGAAGAVADAEMGVVLAAEDAVADPELTLVEGDGLASEAAASEHERVSGLVELADVAAVVGEHDIACAVASGGAPPVDEQALLRSEWVVDDGEPAVLGSAGEVGLGVARAELGERLPLGDVALAAVLAKGEGAELLAEDR
jgi:hypothetical protein